MDFDRLTEFAVIARYGSIKKAAQELGLSCATLSARLIRFEEHLGTALFDRNGQSLRLTPAGQQLLLSATDILERLALLGEEMRAAQAHAYHHLRIAISGSSMPLYLGPFLDELNLAYPDIRLEILDDRDFGILDGLQSGAVDIYFAPVMEDFSPRRFAMRPIAAASQYVVLPRNHPLADRSMVSIRELDREQFLLYPRTAESAIRDFQLRNLQASGIRYTVYDDEVSTLFYKLLVPVGKGLLLRPTPMMDLPPNTVCLPVTDLRYPATPCFFYDKANPKPDVQAFVRDFPRFAKEVVPREHRQNL